MASGFGFSRFVARAAHIQLHAMTLTCADYAAVAPADGEVDAAVMLSLTARELPRIATSAVAHRGAPRRIRRASASRGSRWSAPRALRASPPSCGRAASARSS